MASRFVPHKNVCGPSSTGLFFCVLNSMLKEGRRQWEDTWYVALHSALCWCHTIVAALDKTACTSWLHLLMLLAGFDQSELLERVCVCVVLILWMRGNVLGCRKQHDWFTCTLQFAVLLNYPQVPHNFLINSASTASWHFWCCTPH